MSPRFTDLVRALPGMVPFVGPETLARQRGRAFVARLGANESAFGPPPAALAALRAAADDVWMYPDPTNHDLRQALAAHAGVPAASVVVGAGIDGLLGTLVRLTVAPGDPVVTSDGAYPTFAYHVAAAGGALTRVPYRHDFEDPDGLAAAARATDAHLVYIANPDNPMGTWHPPETIAALRKALPTTTLLVLDEAYVEFAPTAPPLDPGDAGVIRLRTFSKAYGMAGARVGYALGHPETIAAFEKIRDHFGVPRPAQAGALAALSEPAWLADLVAAVAGARDRIGEIAAANGLTALPSSANFVALDCGGDGDHAARVVAALADRGIFVRMPFAGPQRRCIRVTAAPTPALDAFAGALPGALRDAASGV